MAGILIASIGGGRNYVDVSVMREIDLIDRTQWEQSTCPLTNECCEIPTNRNLCGSIMHRKCDVYRLKKLE